MSISRRQFIIGTAAGLILPSYYDKVLAFWENHGEPLLEIPRSSDIELIANDWGGGIIEFNVGEGRFDPPIPMTRRECARRYFGGEQNYLDAHCCARHEVDFDDFENEDMVHTCWTRQDSPSAKGHHLLKDLDLGPNLNSPTAVGQIDFVDCPNMCSDYLGVETEDPVSVSLLQKRLNELNTGIRITMVQGE